jgi:xanthine dehydrogenase iron-sulfur cluster and FAD-binding subunit A
MWNRYVNAGSIDEVVEILAKEGSRARIVAGATDLILELERGVRKGIDLMIDVSRIAGLDLITEDSSGWIHMGPLVTHNACAASKLIQEKAFPLARAAWEVGSPQIRNRGTVAGNIITASPANDTITPLMALGARVTLRSLKGERTVPLNEFYLGVRRTVLREDEMLVDIRFPAMQPNQKGTFIKFALRRAQAISLVNIGIVLTFDTEKIIQNAAITYGAVAPTIIHAKEAEEYLIGRRLEDDTIQHAAVLAMQATRPINDVRGSAGYRRVISKVIAQRGLRAIEQNQEKEGFPEDPVLLDGNGLHASGIARAIWHDENAPIITRINGKEILFGSGQNKTLLRLLREEGLLIGTKEGCAEGECGACTVFLDGAAVMGCMVPAPRAHGAEIVTIEGLSEDGRLHPVQQSFVDQGAVQCGYCTPGFVMSAVKLLEERPLPSENEIKQAITGNLCRCTGYYKIIQAIELAAQERGK